MKALRKQKIETANIQVGDQMVIPLAELGEFTATAHKVTDEGVMFIFDECVTCRPMNNCSTKKGGFEKSDLKKWMDTVLFMAFPEELRDKIYGLTIPTVGQIVGHEDEWDNKNLEPDSDEQLPLMKECKNRIACFEDQLTWGWLRNATKEEFSSAYFAGVNAGGYADCFRASEGEDVVAIPRASVVEKTEPVITVLQEESIPIATEEMDGSEEVIPKMSREDVELIALVTMAEAEGECEEGKRLVIDTILNRVDSEHFPDTVYEVIYQPNQFSSMWNGRVDRCEVRADICDLVYEELESRSNYDVVFFTAGEYSAYGVPMFQVENHYFSRYE